MDQEKRIIEAAVAWAKALDKPPVVTEESFYAFMTELEQNLFVAAMHYIEGQE